MDERWTKPLTELRFIVVDFETTGLYPKRGDRACEIALVKLEGGEPEALYSSLLDPERPIPQEAQQVHGITDEMVAGKPKLEEVLPQILPLFEGSILAAYNAPFEIGFLKAALERVGLSLCLPCLDVLELSKWLVPSKGYRLERVARELGLKVKRKELHRAPEDALVTAQVLDRLLERLVQRGYRNLSDVKRRLGDKVAFDLQISPPQKAGRLL